MKYIVYKITNIINNNIYIGVHTTNNINDGYMGSGTNIKLAIKEYGKHNFKKEILYIYDNEVDMLNKESELVDEKFIKREDTYNIIKGGSTFLTTGCVTVKDKDGNTFMVNIDDNNYKIGEYTHILKGMVTVKDKDGNIFKVSIDDPRYLSGELVHNHTNMVTVKDKDGNTFKVSIDDSRYLSGELVHNHTNMVTVKDKDGNTFKVSIDDSRYLSGELAPFNKGLSNTTSIGMVVTKDIFGNIHRVSVDDPIYLSGELVPFNKNNVTVRDKDGNIFNVSVDDPRYLSGELVFFQKGYKRSKYIKDKISKSLIGNKRRLGIKHTDESKKKMSNSLKGRKAPNKMEIYQMDLNGNIIKKWESIKKASEELKLFNISEAISGNRKTCGGFKWVKV